MASLRFDRNVFDILYNLCLRWPSVRTSEWVNLTAVFNTKQEEKLSGHPAETAEKNDLDSREKANDETD